ALGDGEGDFKKSDGLLREPEPVRFDWVHRHRGHFEVSIMCDVLQVSRSGYYVWVDRPPSRQERRRRELIEQICRVHEESFGTYGSPRTHADLIDRKIDVCVNTV